MYKQKTVTVVGQPQGDKIKIRHEDGREELVPKAEVTGAEGASGAGSKE